MALLELRTETRVKQVLAPEEVPSNVRHVASALSDLLREAAASSP